MIHSSSAALTDPRRQQILDAAHALLLSGGYDTATISAIAAATHLSKTTIYTWWASKEDLFGEVLEHETVQLLDDWMARLDADPSGGTVAGLYRHGFLALAANPVMLALYRRESHMLGTFVRRRGPAIYTSRYLASLEMVRALQSVHLIRSDLPDVIVNHILLILQVGLVMMDDVFDATLFPPFATVAQALADLLQRALASAMPIDPVAAKAAIQAHFARMRSLIVASFAPSGTPES